MLLKSLINSNNGSFYICPFNFHNHNLTKNAFEFRYVKSWFYRVYMQNGFSKKKKNRFKLKVEIIETLPNQHEISFNFEFIFNWNSMFVLFCCCLNEPQKLGTFTCNIKWFINQLRNEINQKNRTCNFRLCYFGNPLILWFVCLTVNLDFEVYEAYFH